MTIIPSVSPVLARFTVLVVALAAGTLSGCNGSPTSSDAAGPQLTAQTTMVTPTPSPLASSSATQNRMATWAGGRQKQPYSVIAQNVDDVMTIYLNGATVATIGFCSPPQEIFLSTVPGDNALRIVVENTVNPVGYTWGYDIRRNGTTIEHDSCGVCGSTGCSSVPQLGVVLDVTFTLSDDGAQQSESWWVKALATAARKLSLVVAELLVRLQGLGDAWESLTASWQVKKAADIARDFSDPTIRAQLLDEAYNNYGGRNVRFRARLDDGVQQWCFETGCSAQSWNELTQEQQRSEGLWNTACAFVGGGYCSSYYLPNFASKWLE